MPSTFREKPAPEAPGSPETGLEAVLYSHLGRLEEEKDALGRELLRAHEQLSLILEVTESSSASSDPDLIRETLLRRYGSMLRAGAVFVDRTGCCMRIETDRTGEDRVQLTPEHLRSVLGAHVEAVRQNRRSIVAPLTQDESAALNGASVLLATLPHSDEETGVVIALRSGSADAFDAHDVLASDSVLAHGARMLSNASTIQHMWHTTLQTVCALVNAIDAKDNYTSDHSERVGGLARLTGEALGLPKSRLQALEWAGLLHDVGKIGVPELILNKPGVLTASELAEMKKHPRIGYDMLKPVAQFESVLDAVLCHHENHDGSGYPEGRRGDEIPLDARIIHVVDIFDAVTTNRPYRKAYGPDHALALLAEDAGRVTEPEVTRLFIEALRRHLAEEPSSFRTHFAHLSGQEPAPVRP